MLRKCSHEGTGLHFEKSVVTPVSGKGFLAHAGYRIYESPECLIYDCSEKPQIYLYDLDDGGIARHALLPNHIIGFMLEGSVCITFPDASKYLFRKGQMIFMPSGSIYTWNIMERTQLLVYRLQDPGFRLCEKFPVESLCIEDVKYLWPEQDDNPEAEADRPKPEFSILKIHPRLLRRLESIRDNFADGVRCKKFFEMEIETFFILLRCYYDKRDLYSFMRFILTGNMIFTEYVRLRWKKYSTVAGLAASMNMSTKNFSRKFILFFGQRPSLWIANNRARLILDELTASGKPLKQIASEQKFSSFPQFSAFTKRMLGKPPSEIRNGEGAYPDE